MLGDRGCLRESNLYYPLAINMTLKNPCIIMRGVKRTVILLGIYICLHIGLYIYICVCVHVSARMCAFCLKLVPSPNSILISTSSQKREHAAHCSHLRDTLRHLAHSMRYSKGSQKCSKSIWIRSVSKMKPRAIHSRKLAKVPWKSD